MLEPTALSEEPVARVPFLEPVPDEPNVPDEEATLLEPVDEAVEFPPVVVDVELRETNIPPMTRDGEVLLPVLAAASLYASRVLGDGSALISQSDRLHRRWYRI